MSSYLGCKWSIATHEVWVDGMYGGGDVSWILGVWSQEVSVIRHSPSETTQRPSFAVNLPGGDTYYSFAYCSSRGRSDMLERCERCAIILCEHISKGST
jgi:hypothetical protein